MLKSSALSRRPYQVSASAQRILLPCESQWQVTTRKIRKHFLTGALRNCKDYHESRIFRAEEYWWLRRLLQLLDGKGMPLARTKRLAQHCIRPIFQSFKNLERKCWRIGEKYSVNVVMPRNERHWQIFGVNGNFTEDSHCTLLTYQWEMNDK